MIFQYGNHQHRAGEVGLTIASEAVRTQAGTQWAQRERLQINGLLTSQMPTEALMKADILARTSLLEQAYASDGFNAIWKHLDGTVVKQWISAGFIGGLRVVQNPSYPRGAGAEMVTLRYFVLGLEAIVPVSNPETLLESFNETFQPNPAGGLTGHLPTLVGPPIKQTLRLQQVFRAVQSGQAVGKFSYPVVPPPLFPGDLVNGYNPPIFGQPKRNRGTLYDWPVSWRYEFESANPMWSAPHIWGTTYPY